MDNNIISAIKDYSNTFGYRYEEGHTVWLEDLMEIQPLPAAGWEPSPIHMPPTIYFSPKDGVIYLDSYSDEGHVPVSVDQLRQAIASNTPIYTYQEE